MESCMDLKNLTTSAPQPAATPRGASVHPPKTIRNACWLLTILVTLSCSYFYTGGGWNQAAHFDLIRAIVEQGTIHIDAYHENTGDKSLYDGHYYSNKAPGTAFLAVPLVAAVNFGARLLGVPPESPSLLQVEERIATLVSGSLPTAAAAVFIFLIGLRCGASFHSASIGALALGLGTPNWVYGTFLWAHALVSACLVGAMTAAIYLRRHESARRDRLLGFLTGLSIGWSILTEVQSGGAALIIGALSLWHGFEGGSLRLRRVALFLALGALGPILLLGCYNAAAFGSPLRLSYSAVVGFEGHREGFLGVTYPKMRIVGELLIGAERGLFCFAPVMLAAPLGLLALARSSEHRPTVAATLAAFLYFLLLNASFHYWKGGWSYGPRYLAPGLALLSVGIAAAWNAAKPKGRTFVTGLGILSIFLTLAAVSTNPMPPETATNPQLELILPVFFGIRMSRNGKPVPGLSWNAGEWMGLHGHATLIPLLVAWIVIGVLWIRNERSSTPPEAGHSG
jgi:hypothetical protein